MRLTDNTAIYASNETTATYTPSANVELVKLSTIQAETSGEVPPTIPIPRLKNKEEQLNLYLVGKISIANIFTSDAWVEKIMACPQKNNIADVKVGYKPNS